MPRHDPPSGVPDPTGRTESLDGIRGIAALVVMLSHFKHALRNANELSGAGWDEWLLYWPLRLLWGGDEALFSFFVLSGFVLAQPFLRPRPPSWREFAGRRMRRLYPTYAWALVLSWLCAWLLRPARTADLAFILNGYPQPDMPVATLIGQALLLIDVNNVNPSLWALVQAMRVALIYPLLFLAIRFLGAGRALVLSALLSLAAVLFSGSVTFPDDWAVLGHSLLKTGYFLFFFVLGTALAMHRAWLLHRLTGNWRDARPAFAIIGVGLMGLKMYLPYLMGPLAVGLGFAAILLVVLATARAGAVLRARPLKFLGTISYSLFLLHLPVIFIVVYLLHGRVPFAVILAASAAAAIAVAWVFWLVVERPAMGRARRCVPAPPRHG